MKFEEVDNTDTPYKITFEGAEVDVVQAVYMEDISLRIQKGNVGSFSDFDKALSRWDGDRDDFRGAYFVSHEALVEKFENFYERTDSVLIEIANERTVPDYMKTFLVTRHTLGRKALELAQQIRAAAVATEAPLPDPDSLDIDSELSNFFSSQPEQESPD